MSQPYDDRKTSPCAIWSLVLGIPALGLGCLLGVPGLILGIIGATNTSKPGSLYKGKGLAITGIVLSSVGMVTGTIIGMLLISIPVGQNLISQAKQQVSISNVHQLHLTIAAYAADNNDQLPANLKVLLSDGYTDEQDIFIDPFHPMEPEGYELVPGAALDSSPPVPMIRSIKSANVNGKEVRTVGYTDGRVETEEVGAP